MKVALKKREKMKGGRGIHWTASQPFIENSRGVLIHRPEYVTTYKAHWNESYLIIKNFCGSTFCGTHKFTFLDAPPEGKILCARCEDEAVKEGLPTAEKLVGRHVHTGGVIGVRNCCLEERYEE